MTSTLVLSLSEDAYLGDAAFTVNIDGIKQGGTQTVTALHDKGQFENFVYYGNFGTSAPVVEITFLNDAYKSGATGGDRNLYVKQITLDGATTAINFEQKSAGTVSYKPQLRSANAPAEQPEITISKPVQTANSTTVSLNGTIAGTAGTSVEIYNGSTAIGTASLNNSGGWSYTASLTAANYNFRAVATDLFGNTAAANDAGFTVQPQTDNLTLNLSEDAYQGDAQFTVSVDGVQIGSPLYVTASHALGQSQNFSFTENFGAGPHKVAVTFLNDAYKSGASGGDRNLYVNTITLDGTTCIENYAQLADGTGYFTFGPLPTAPGSLTAYVSSGNTPRTTTTVNIDGSSSFGTLVPLSPAGSIGLDPLVLYNWNPATQLTHFLAAESAVAAGTAGARAKIVAIGDSTSLGYGSADSNGRALSYPVELSRALTQDGVRSQYDNFLGGPDSNDTRITLVNGAYWWVGGGPVDAGGYVVNTQYAGEGADFTLNTPGNYDRVDISYIDMGSGSVTVGINGGPVLATLHFGNTGKTMTQTVDIPAGLHSQVNIRAASPKVYIEGASFWNSTSPAVEVYNAGIAGWDSTQANTSIYNGATLTGSTDGYGETAGAAALHPNLAIIDIGINDITYDLDSTAKSVANISQMIASLRSVGSDVIIMIPQPFGASDYATELPALRSALQSLSLAQNVPIIDLSATYGDDLTALYNAGLMYDLLHPDATLYADNASKIAALLASAVTSESTAVTMAGSAGDDTLTGTAAANTLIGNGGNDTYNLKAAQIDTIVNGTAASTAAQGELNVTNATHDQIWFQQSGNNLVVDVLGTHEQATIQNWYGSTGGKLQDVAADDGVQIDSSLQSLVQAMASFAAATGFNPTTTTHTSLTDSNFGTLTAAAAAAWHS